MRTAIVRTLANDPRMLLRDEPFGALCHPREVMGELLSELLSEPLSQLMRELLLGIWEEQRETALFVTHDIDEAVFMGGRAFVMSARPGRIKPDREVPIPPRRHYSIKTT